MEFDDSDDPVAPKHYIAEFTDWVPNYWRRDRMNEYRPSRPERHAIGLSEYRQPLPAPRRRLRAKPPIPSLSVIELEQRREDTKRYRKLIVDYLTAAGKPVKACDLRQALGLTPKDLNAVGMWAKELGLIHRDKHGWQLCPDAEPPTKNPSAWLLKYLQQHGPATIAHLVEATGWPYHRVVSVGKYLVSRQLIIRSEGIWSARTEP